MNIDEYIVFLQGFQKDYDKIVQKGIMANEGTIVGMLKQRLYQYGTDGNDRVIGEYAASTIKAKKAKGQPTAFVTLRDTGAWYAGMHLIGTPATLDITSSDWKTIDLTQMYGPAILQLTEYQQDLIINTILDPYLDNYLDNMGDLDIDIDM